MSIKVLKFGGSSLADAGQFEKVAKIVKAEPERRYVVASAPGKRFDDDIKVTDLLYECYEKVSEGENIDNVFEKIINRYNGIISELGIEFSLDAEFDKIKASIEHHAGRDYVASRGEYLNAMILAKYLGYDFIDAERGIYFTDNGSFDSEKTYDKLTSILEKHDRAVIPGFYGKMPNGTIKTFSRGGSDITGSIVARAAQADIYENWTDVSGMLMADPRCVENPAVIELITYRELRELAYMGATVMHEDAIFPVREACIPINIRNTNSPLDNGTMIVPDAPVNKGDKIITGIAGRKGFSLISIEKDMMNAEIGFGRKVLEVIEKHGVSFEHLPSGIDTMTVIVSTDAIDGIRDEITSELFKTVKADTVSMEDGIALIAVVGRGMIKAKGTAARVFKAISAADVNIKMIDQGSSERNIIIGVDEEHYEDALRAIYSEFEK